MTVNLTPYRNFTGAAREAMEAYQRILGGEVQFMTFGDMPGNDASIAELIMHSELRIDGKPVLFASDVPEEMDVTPGDDTPLSLTGSAAEDGETLTAHWNSLKEIAETVQVELAQAPWGDSFGMLTDKFGTRWMINIIAAR
ncbi:glyoxalase/bleomycin resistance/extradiol dioxygenase family protein [Corynebacterium sp. 153RC1]|uniref:VOC family protein n=1 Tax=unclassified Corynebacterium TaxID=2624378 RepID=UPI00211B8429|nr:MULTISPECIES: glyoxalase/bleomycin resistance/extradiol dioxygenase family protein [unclassified Corynebacterium]MCQ9369858.1 glyoxalase/bleomycin resistance/extradiol dioxygenase family protein [Corynebacterium sp. 35RC1]MCQ9352303.1 glyoxalase/bleomycin resistance/extradiol dioxygenase family protein [Corynebacterium sp. 209RC1]MCQ9354307.1 glyoxalase/bleomycin resistance/extradiol dioxygenase family protein [Corynebacterium sp. 1222RC1]MCQ9356589.1 glyoxalase/bleomycin resistance/extradio